MRSPMHRHTTAWQYGKLGTPSKHALSCVPGIGAPVCLHASVAAEKILAVLLVCQSESV